MVSGNKLMIAQFNIRTGYEKRTTHIKSVVILLGGVGSFQVLGTTTSGGPKQTDEYILPSPGL